MPWACSPDRDEYSFPPMIYDEQAYLQEIAESNDLITLNTTRSNYAVALKKSENVDKALQEKWRLLTGELEIRGEKIGKLCDEVELISFDFEKIGPERFRLYFVFLVLKELKSKYAISIVGRLADPDLLPEPNRDKGFINWYFNPLPPTRFWEEGEYLVIEQDITTPDLPLELQISLFSAQGNYGKTISLGVMGQIDRLPIDRKKVLEENDPFQLWEWLQYCHARSGYRSDLVRERYREVTARLLSKVVVQKGIEYYGASISRTTPARCRLRLLFRVTEPIDRDYWSIIYGLVSPENRKYLSEPLRKAGKKAEKWYLPVYPPTSNWEEGKFIVVIYDLEVAPISYNFFAFFYDRQKKKAGPKFELGILKAPQT